MTPKFNQSYGGINCRVYLVRENETGEVITLDQPEKVYELVKDELSNSDRERFLSVMLTTKNHLIGVETVSVGSVCAAIVSPREVFKSAILANAASIVLCHNHPSGDLAPSIEDINLTKHLIDAGKLLGINVFDHIIVTHRGYKSLTECINFTK